MLARSFPEIKHIDFKHYVESDMKFLAGLGLFSDEPIGVRGQKVSPWAVLQALLDRLPPETKKAPEIHSEVKVIVKGEENKHRVEYGLMVRPSPEGNKKYLEKGCSPGFRTGICIGLAGVMVGRGQVKEKGVLPPELCIPPELYLEEFSKAGFEVKIDRKEIL
jgi:lysine 6-dehydrogenase